MGDTKWDKVRAFRWYLSCCDFGQEVLYLILCSLYKGGDKHPELYINQVLRWTYQQYVTNFNRSQRARIRMDDENHFDIHKAAMAYGIDVSLVLLKWTCGLTSPEVTKWQCMPPDSFEHRLHVIGSNVQQFYDDTSTAFESEECLKEEIEGLKELYTNVLREAESRTGVDFTYATAAVLSSLDKILSHHTPVEDPQRYSKLLHREGVQELLGEIITEDLKIRPLQMTPMRLDSVYTELSLLEQNLAGNFTITPRFFSASRILREVTNGNKKFHGRAVVGGPVGCGKTTLFRQMLNVWVRGSFGIPDLEKVELFFFVNLSTIKATTADQLLREEILPCTTSCFPPGRILPALRKLCVLWVLDGYDRANESSRNLANEVYKKFPLVFLTCQQDFLPVCLPVVVESGIPPLCLILDHPRGTRDSALANKVFRQLKSDDTREFMQFLVARANHHDHLMLMPLHVTLLSILFIYNPESMKKVHSLTDLYRRLVFEIVNILTQSVADKTNKIRNDFFINVVRPWLKIMAEDAWVGLKDGSHLLQERSLQKIKEVCGKETIQLLDGLLDSKPRRDGQSDYFWALGELQDHFAATHLSNLLRLYPTTNLEALMGEINPRFNNMLLHLLGILAPQEGKANFKYFSRTGVEIIQYLEKTGYGREKEHCLAGKVNRWLAVCLEARLDTSLLTNVVDILPQLRFGDDDLTLYYPVIEKILLQYDDLLVSFQIKHELRRTLELSKILRAIVHMRHKIWLALVSSATAYGNKEVADWLLEEPLEKKKLQIMSVEGHFSSSFLLSMPETVQQLHIRVMTTEELKALANSIQKLTLYAFNLVLDMPGLRHEDAVLPTLKIKWLQVMVNIPFPGLWLFVPLLEDSHVPWLFQALKYLYPTHYDRLYLTACRLTLAGERHVITKLRKATNFKLDELIFDKPDGTCRHYNFLAERANNKEGAGSLTSQ